MIIRAWAPVARTPMYRVVLAALSLLVIVSFIASFAGALYFSAAELIVLLLVVGVVTVGVSRIAARLWRTESHDESSLITALLLFFILKPGLEPADLAAAAGAAAAAGLSKFLIAWRGRHLFNPAAFGIFVVTVSGIGADYWWIGSSTLLWAVLPVAMIVVIRLRQTLIAGAATLSGLLTSLASALSWGSDPLDALQMGIASTALVFFAAFMVTEPLTLPPRRRQRLLVAILTGALFAAPITFGPVTMTPQLALLLGNLAAFAWGQRRAITLTLQETRRSPDSTVELLFHPATPVRFHAGQAIELHIPGGRALDRRGNRRVFSLVSAPSDTNQVRVAFSLPERPSAAKQRLTGLQPGAVIRATGVSGDFLRRPNTKSVMVAAGIGITPFISWLRDASVREERLDAILVFAITDPDTLHFRRELEQLSTPVIIVSPAPPARLAPQERWAGPHRLSGERMAELIPDLAQREAYVSGRPTFVSEMRNSLRSRTSKVHTDNFAGY